MKKLCFLFISIFLFALNLSSCFINDNDDIREKAPTLRTSGDSIVVSVDRMTNTKYINVFRTSAADAEFKDDVETLNIAQIIPIDDNIQSFSFVDTDTYTGRFYKYFIRYWNGSFYTYTKETDSWEGKNTDEAKLSIAGADPIAQLNYEENNQTKYYKLFQNSTIGLPAGYDELDVIINNGSVSRPFTLGDGTSGEDIDFQRVLPPDFLDTKLKIEGVIGVKISKEGENKASGAKTYTWTKRSDVNLTWDLINEDGVMEQDDYEITEFVVPTPGDVDNPCDYNPPNYSIRDASLEDVLIEEYPLDFTNPFAR